MCFDFDGIYNKDFFKYRARFKTLLLLSKQQSLAISFSDFSVTLCSSFYQTSQAEIRASFTKKYDTLKCTLFVEKGAKFYPVILFIFVVCYADYLYVFLVYV